MYKFLCAARRCAGGADAELSAAAALAPDAAASADAEQCGEQRQRADGHVGARRRRAARERAGAGARRLAAAAAAAVVDAGARPRVPHAQRSALCSLLSVSGAHEQLPCEFVVRVFVVYTVQYAKSSTFTRCGLRLDSLRMELSLSHDTPF